MKTILIIYPHWHPANLAGVQRPRLIGNYLKSLGWKPRVLTVKAAYFEEKPDVDFHKIFTTDFEVTRVDAIKVYKPRLIGDIGLRAFFSLYKEAKRIIRHEQIDFIWLPIPSFYNALLGRLLYEKTKVPYGIDYIDPWVRDISNQNNKRAIFSQWIARLLEPIAVKKVSVISGVSTPYYASVIQRNFPEIAEQLLQWSNTTSRPLEYNLAETQNSNGTTQLPTARNLIKRETQNPKLKTPKLINPFTQKPITHVAMPYGFDPNDHTIKLDGLKYPWEEDSEQLTVNSKQSTVSSEQSTNNDPCLPAGRYQPINTKKIWLYAGAFLPNSHVLLDAFFKSIAYLRQSGQWDEDIQLWFIGTGMYPAKRITAYAKDHGIDDMVRENRDRYPFLHILNFLSAADTVLVIGSTEKHYTASKTYQSILSERPVVSIFHHQSSAIEVMEDCKADAFTVRYKPEMDSEDIVDAFNRVLTKRLASNDWNPDLSALNKYSCKESARKLVEAIEVVVTKE